MFQTRAKHTPDPEKKRPPADGRQLILQQSILRGFIAALAVVIVFNWAWALLSMLVDRIFPWLGILAAFPIGIAMQRYGRGLDWRFPLLAAVIAFVSVYFGILLISILETARYIEASSFEVILGLSSDTFRNFFRNTITPIHHIYAFSAAGIAAFFANRRLKRHEVHGLAIYRKQL